MSWDGRILADARHLPIADESIQCVVTSPPYWGLRDYGNDNQIGLETTPEAYVDSLVDVFDDVSRVLKPDGTVWLNLGDCYATGAGKIGNCPGGGQQGARWRGDVERIRDTKRSRALRDGSHAGKHTAISAMGPMTQPNRMPIPGLKPKDLVGIPWRVAFALQQQGWYLRMDIIWAKRNCMPESVTDRPTRSHEYVFLLSKSAQYFYDHDAIKELADPEAGRDTTVSRRQAPPGARTDTGFQKGRRFEYRNKRSVWLLSSAPFKDAHYATFPPDLVEPCILAGSRPGDIVLDPFFGSGTVGMVAEKLSRRWVGCDLGYQDLQAKRLKNIQKVLI